MKTVIFDFDGVIHDTLDIAYGINKRINPDMGLDEYKDYFNGNLYEHPRVTAESNRKFFCMLCKGSCFSKITHMIVKTQNWIVGPMEVMFK